MCNSLFKTPNEWIRDNVAGFLLFCSENIILYYIGGMIETEEELEVRKAAILVSDMIIMSNRFENEFTSKKGMGKQKGTFRRYSYWKGSHSKSSCWRNILPSNSSS